jgi:hypothetical protein
LVEGVRSRWQGPSFHFCRRVGTCAYDPDDRFGSSCAWHVSRNFGDLRIRRLSRGRSGDCADAGHSTDGFGIPTSKSLVRSPSPEHTIVIPLHRPTKRNSGRPVRSMSTTARAVTGVIHSLEHVNVIDAGSAQPNSGSAIRGGVFDDTLIFRCERCMCSMYMRAAISLSPFVAQGFLSVLPLGIAVAVAL